MKTNTSIDGQGLETCGILGVRFNGGHGDHPFVQVYFATLADAEWFHGALAEMIAHAKSEPKP